MRRLPHDHAQHTAFPLARQRRATRAAAADFSCRGLMRLAGTDRRMRLYVMFSGTRIFPCPLLQSLGQMRKCGARASQCRVSQRMARHRNGSSTTGHCAAIEMRIMMLVTPLGRNTAAGSGARVDAAAVGAALRPATPAFSQRTTPFFWNVKGLPGQHRPLALDDPGYTCRCVRRWRV